jgi:hypothetical protein
MLLRRALMGFTLPFVVIAIAFFGLAGTKP